MVGYTGLSASKLDLLILNGHDEGLGTYAAEIRAFVAAGGGLLVGNHVWTWSGPAATHPSNILLHPMGIVVSASWAAADATLSATQPPPQTANAEVGLACLEATLRGNASHPCLHRTDDDISAAMESLAGVAAYTPWGGSFWSRLATVCRAGIAVAANDGSYACMHAGWPAGAGAGPPLPHTGPLWFAMQALSCSMLTLFLRCCVPGLHGCGLQWEAGAVTSRAGINPKAPIHASLQRAWG